jgi:rhamnose utilization protein RhaD (predicted bifunctional aldolase and dehydrogenase)
VAPGFVLAQRVAELGLDEASPRSDPGEARHLQLGSERRGELRTHDRRGARQTTILARERRHPQISVAVACGAVERAGVELEPLLRGALRASAASAFVLEWRDGPAVLDFLGRPGPGAWSPAAASHPTTVIRTKPFPAWLDGGQADARSHRSVARARSRPRWRLCQRLRRYFWSTPRPPQSLTRLDLLPRVVAVPGLGIAGWAATSRRRRSRQISTSTRST